MSERHVAVYVTANYLMTPYFSAVSADDSTSCNPTNNKSTPATLITTSPVMMAPRSSTRLTSSASESCSSGPMASGRSVMLHESIGGPGPGERYAEPHGIDLLASGLDDANEIGRAHV